MWGHGLVTTVWGPLERKQKSGSHNPTRRHLNKVEAEGGQDTFSDSCWKHHPEQWFSPLLMLGPFNTAPQAVVTPNCKIIFNAIS